jgi:hypothetical protein
MAPGPSSPSLYTRAHFRRITWESSLGSIVQIEGTVIDGVITWDRLVIESERRETVMRRCEAAGIRYRTEELESRRPAVY